MRMENKVWYSDYWRTTDDKKFILKHFVRDYIFQHRLRYMVNFRNAQKQKIKIIKIIYEFKCYIMCRKYGIEVKTNTSIGEGFVMLHPYNITIAPKAKIGRNVTICKGATVGLCNAGKTPGTPIIGDRVYIGLNSTIVGGVIIGDDVMIAPNAFVNCDIPSHSVVVGNPCEIHFKKNATSSYIWKCV